jgi:catechol 2,3-dioxygenase-like lactoylglutathione lyase family enzyme
MKLGYVSGAAGIVRGNGSERPLGIEIALVTADLEAAHGRALRNGATELSAPAAKPWGQSVSYLRTPDGVLVELCTPVTPRF